jgi:CheY-like chemotaxis protein
MLKKFHAGTSSAVPMADRSNDDGWQDYGRRHALKGLRCLVADDDFLIALDIQDILESAGAAAVTCAGTVTDALTALQNEPAFSVAVLDIGLEDDDRGSVLVALALWVRATPLVFLTRMGGDDRRARQFPEALVVNKPYLADELLAAVRRASRKR